MARCYKIIRYKDREYKVVVDTTLNEMHFENEAVLALIEWEAGAMQALEDTIEDWEATQYTKKVVGIDFEDELEFEHYFTSCKDRK